MSLAAAAPAIVHTDPALNFVNVTGVQSPGRAQLTGVRVPYHYDVQQGYGLSGAVTIFRGRGICKFTLTIVMWLQEHFLAWPIFKKTLEPPTKAKPLVAQMTHPILSSAGITGVAVESMGEPERQTNGMWIATIQLIEYRPPLPALVNPKGSIPGVKGKPIPPKTEADLALVKAQADLASVRNGGPRVYP